MKKARDIHKLLKEVDLTVNPDVDREVLERVLKASRKSTVPVIKTDDGSILTETGLCRPTFWRKAGYLAATLLIVSSLVTCFIQSREIAVLKDQLKEPPRGLVAVPTDAATTINLYLKEHENVIARHASLSQARPEPMQIKVNQDDILYYELLDGQPDTMRPGIIVRGSLSQGHSSPPKAPIISNGHTLSLSEAKETADFDLMAPPWLDPGFALEKIRSIEGRDAMQLLYTDGINSISLFEQSLDGKRGLSHQDFREYAVYNNAEQTGTTILVWKDDVRSYVLIGNTGLSQLMDIAQSITTGK